MDPVRNLQTSYYEHWVDGAERHFVEEGVLSRDEFDARMAEPAGGVASRRILCRSDEEGTRCLPVPYPRMRGVSDVVEAAFCSRLFGKP